MLVSIFETTQLHISEENYLRFTTVRTRFRCG